MKPPKTPIEVPPLEHCLKVINQALSNNMLDLAQEYIEKWSLKIEIRNGKIIDKTNSTSAWLSTFITVNDKMMDVKKDIAKLSTIKDPVLLSGPTGTGKEILARALHGDSEARFIAINCGGLPEQLIESELFGHKQGAFTGAVTTKHGLMKLAGDGTIFLDEIGELPLAAQAKLLRAIQEKEIRKVGGDEDEKINCRIVCATLKDLKEMVKTNHFRIDLYARISTFEVDTTPLDERREDIVPIIESLEDGPEFLATIGDKISEISTPLNVRSLQQYVRRFKVLGKIYET
jgi:transcriptional regulator with PAS, ATPase and Fis domain